jgi:hypothetical protein
METTGQLSSHFVSEVDMSHMLAVLHNAHNTGLKGRERLTRIPQNTKRESCLNLVTPLLVNAITRLFPLIARFYLRYDGTDLDLPQIRGKLVIERKRITWIHITTWRMLLQDLVFGAS